MSFNISESHAAKAAKLVERTRANNGLAPLDIDRFWEDEAKAHADPWAEDSPQVPLGIRMSRECLFAELGLEEDWYRLTHDPAYVTKHAKPYNDRAEQIVGRRLLSEDLPDPAKQVPSVKALSDIFEAKNAWRDESYWLMQSADTPDELTALLDRVEERLADLRAFMLPPDWEDGKQRALDHGGSVPLYRSQRGPVTFAMSVYGVENMIFLILDRPELAARFRDLILRAMLERARILDEEAGHTPDSARRGFYWSDDNCAMLNAEMYEFFGYPILKGMFDRYSPDAGDMRGQHSDSDMEHLLPVLARLDMTSTNFGPTVMVDRIREHMPRAVISGQLAPFVFSRNEEENIVAELIRDFERSREKRGLVFATAGSINNGSRLTGMRLIMAAIQEYGRYD